MQIEDLKKLRTLKQEFPDMTVKDLDEVLDTFAKWQQNLVAAEQKKAAENQQRNAVIQQVSELLKTNGISFADFAKYGIENNSGFRKKRKPIGKAKAKYAYTDLNGNAQTWTGRGRMPVPFAEFLKATGKTKEEFLIKTGSDSENEHGNIQENQNSQETQDQSPLVY